MSIGNTFAKDLEQESKSAREMLERISSDTFDWKPHEKSMSMKQLAGLVGGMFGWFELMVDHPELDFAKAEKPPELNSTEDLIALFDASLAKGLASLKNAKDETFSENWKLRHGDQIFMELTKGEVCRQTFGHLAHHRGQLSVYMRLKDIPVPSIYGPTADDPTF